MTLRIPTIDDLLSLPLLNRIPMEIGTVRARPVPAVMGLVVCVAAAAFSPLLAFYLAAILLTVGSPVIPCWIRRISGLLMVLSGSLIASSRQTLESRSDDLHSYFRVFERLQDGWSNVWVYGDGFEPLLPLYLKLLATLFPDLSPNGVAFFVSLACGLIFWAWLETCAVRQTAREKRGILVGVAFVFFMFFMATQLMRQMLAFTLLLHALSTRDWRFSGPVALLSGAAHLTAFPIFVLGRLLQWRRDAGYILTATVAAGLLLLFPLLLEVYRTGALDVVPGIHKLNYYLSAGAGYTQPDLRMYPILSLTFVAFLFTGGRQVFAQFWPAMFLSLFILYLYLLPYPLMSLRISMLITAVATGFFIFLAVQRVVLPFVAAFSAFCLYRFARQGPLYSGGGDMSTWAAYPYISPEPFYYWPAFFW